ncbi:S49 family peptidase [Xanthomonas theicola]|uniref:S49 family peptidase n=1 Tax=Xanthomonas theicola TaxID=56464 RepID=UPI001473B15C|nr:S49 family peptidase [Xanthomonas theicola]
MTSKPGLLARLFGRSKRPVVASLATAALNQPLLVHAAMGEALIGAYLEGAVTSDDTVLTCDRMVIDAASTVTLLPPEEAPPAERAGTTIAVINVTGGLVNRPMPGPSGGGPVSYAALRDVFDEVISDDGIDAVVLRLDSPGGMAAGCFDLVDRIHAARGSKPIHALVDDCAYSAAYALASACHEIWVSRTGGVGSIGVVGFHYDWSGNNAQVGLKVTPIYGGERKIDLNQNFPISEEARAAAQAEIDMLYGLFVETVARNRGMDEAAVRATEAATFRGAGAVSAGFATRLGTWDDLVAQLGLASAAPPEQPGDPDAGEESSAAAAPGAAADAVVTEAAAVDRANLGADVAAVAPRLAVAALSEAVAGSELPAELKVALIRRGPRADEDPAAAMAYAVAVRDACAAATRGGESLAADYITSNTDLAAVRSQLLALKAEEGRAAQIVTTLPASDAAKREADVKASLNPATIYQKRGN